MVKIALLMKVSLENVAELKPSVPEFKWYLKFACSNCGEVSEKWNYVSLSEVFPAQRGNAVNHYHSKCKLCSRENTMAIVENSVRPIVNDGQEDFQMVATFDCRGLEPVDFSAREGWIVKAVENGKEFTDVDLSEGEWADYCDRIKQPVGIYEIEHKFSKVG